MRCDKCQNEMGIVDRFDERDGVVSHTQKLHCSSCDHTVELVTATEVEADEVSRANRISARGPRTPVEFKFLRKMTGLKAAELAVLLDVNPQTVSRWESGAVPIPRAAAFVLVELYQAPVATTEKLLALGTPA